MGVMSKEWYRRRAIETLHKKDELEVDESSAVSSGSSPGGWVRAWVWVPDPKNEETNGKETGPADGEVGQGDGRGPGG